LQERNLLGIKMNRYLKNLAIVALMGLATPVLAASNTATADGTATAQVVVPISVSNVSDLDFGNLTPNGSASVVNVSATGVRTGPADVLVGGGSPNPATFVVDGDLGRAFTFSLPVDGVLLSSGTDTMMVDGWTSDAPATLADGPTPVNVGAALHVAPTQPAGAYAGTFAVTATYN
jgi:spore coat protein U-like protein